MGQTMADVQLVLVAENPNFTNYATTALADCRGVAWHETPTCAVATEWLQHHPTDVVVLLQSSQHDSLSVLRQFWSGPLLCFCDDDDNAMAAVEAAHALALLPPFATRQVASALRHVIRLATQHSPAREGERRLEQAQRMEAVGRLAGGVAHDFNNLLTVISSYSDLAMRKLDDGHVVQRYVEQIRKASATAATLTRQLLAFSRRQVMQPRVIALNEIVDEISFMVQSLLGAGIELRMHLEPELGQIEADPAQLQQVLLNLIVNAKDAMPEGGLLDIETRNFELDARYVPQFPNVRPGAYVRLTIADTGIGMDDATLARIYEPFFTTKPKGRGTGLGLPTVFGIVQQSGGHISVYSEVGKGTTFHVYLPRVDKMIEQPSAQVEAQALLKGRETILLVEDEQGVRELAAVILHEAGYQLLIAATPEEAMMIAQSHPERIDLLLTDVIMPRMTGRDVAAQVVRYRPATPVVYMSGYTEDVMVFQQLLDVGAYLVEKPFYPSDLLRMVRRALDQPQGQEITVAVAS